MSRRAVITGLGVIAPNGKDLSTFWETVCKPTSSASFINRFDTSTLPTKVGCLVDEFRPELYMDKKLAKRLDISYLYAVSAAQQAVWDAKIDLPTLDPDRVGVIEGTSIGGLNSSLVCHDIYNTKGYRNISPFTLINAYTGGGSSEIAMSLGVSGHATTICTACSSGTDAIGHALNSIQEDDTDVMIAGATEAPMIPGYWGIFCAAKSMSRETEDPSRAMRPFNKDRDGFILGEGAAFVVLEELSHAINRNATIYCEVTGYGRSCDSYHSVAQHPEGRGASKSLTKALRRAQIHPSQVQYINVHGSATPTNDIVETKAIKHVFGPHARSLQISATKPVTGHLAGAAGAIESLICALAIKNSRIPPTMNLTTVDPECDLDYVPNTSRSFPVEAAINMNAGFGGKNACIIFQKLGKL